MAKPTTEIDLSGFGLERLQHIGRGQYANAQLVRESATGFTYVAKCVSLAALNEHDQDLAHQEVFLLQTLNHPYIVAYRDSFLIEGANTLVIVMEYCDSGDLRKAIKEKAKAGEHFAEEQITTWFVQLCLALQYIHSEKVLHRDLKTSNIFLHEGPCGTVIKLGDFGISRVLEGTAEAAVTIVGTPYYMSPEVCRSEPYNWKSDIWALGCVLYECCMLKHAFESSSLLGLVYKIVSDHYDPIPSFYSPELNDLINQLLMKSAESRPSINELFANPYVKAYLAQQAAPVAVEPLAVPAQGAKGARANLRPPGAPRPPPPPPPPPPPAPPASGPAPLSPESRIHVITARIRRRLVGQKLNWISSCASFDDDGDGALTPDALRNAFTTMALGLSDDEIGALTSVLSPEPGAKISLDAFSVHLQEVSPEVQQYEAWARQVFAPAGKRLHDVLRAKDMEMRGTLSPEVFADALLELVPTLTSEHLELLVMLADKTCLGDVDYGEFLINFGPPTAPPPAPTQQPAAAPARQPAAPPGMPPLPGGTSAARPPGMPPLPGAGPSAPVDLGGTLGGTLNMVEINLARPERTAGSIRPSQSCSAIAEHPDNQCDEEQGWPGGGAAASDTSFASSLVPASLKAALGPPLRCLPRSVEANELNAYRADYQAFRTGMAVGARGEIARPCVKRYTQSYRASSKGVKLVPLIGVELGASSAATSAASAASEHLHSLKSSPVSRSAGLRAKVAFSKSVKLAVPEKRHAFFQESPRLPESESGQSFQSSSISEVEGMPWHRGTSVTSGTAPVTSETGVGLVAHIIVSLTFLLPCLLAPGQHLWSCLLAPGAYTFSVVLATARVAYRQGYSCADLFSLSNDTEYSILSRVLRMPRLVREGCVPSWFPALTSAVYVLVAVLLTLGRSFETDFGSRSISLWSATPRRHDYNCWGAHSQEVADCVLVRHSACTMLVSLYTLLVVMALCNRNVKGSHIVAEHRNSLLSLFPMEAPTLFAYIDRSVESNLAHWRTNRRYRVQSILLSLMWTSLSFGVYTELLRDAQSKLAQAVFLTALSCTYLLQYILFRHVLLRVILHFEAIKARAAALAYCDEEGVLPFTSGHAIYVWFLVRRNVSAQNEVSYQHAVPIFTGSVFLAAVSSCWVGSELHRRGMSIFGLTSRGGASLMTFGSACVFCVFVNLFLAILRDIGKLDEAHALQLRIAHLRLEHVRSLRKAQAMKDASKPPSSSSLEPLDRSQTLGQIRIPSLRDFQPVQERKSFGPLDLEASEHDLESAVAMIERVILLIENHESKPTIFGVEIGSKSFQVVYAALLSNLWYLCVWGLLIPLISSKDEDTPEV
ncbi:unnamed protein product [Polarella glacialis]|uniref:non-specific serine/threonine protein kinase n=1 Tax=Polarella glacialis TaxID=89957 RepID=A0A813IVH8_POLGL|nr:unnamed protein product [Polarella glacialis]